MAQQEQRQGFVWGQIYIVLAIVFGIIAIVYGIMALVTGGTAQAPMDWIDGFAIIAIVAGALQLLSGIGVWGRWKWGLYLTYFLLWVQIISGVVNLIMFLVASAEMDNPGFIAGRIIAACIGILIYSLWFGYFVRRRHMFK